MTDSPMPQSWKRNVINFDSWNDDAFGIFEFTPRNYRHFFRFDIQPVGAEIRIFIVSQPGYGTRVRDFNVTHRARNADGRIYVDIHPDQAPKTVPEALAWAVFWAEKTSKYIETGGWVS